MDLLNLYVLFSHFRQRYGTPENCFFPMLSYARAFVCVINEKTKGKFPGEHRVV